MIRTLTGILILGLAAAGARAGELRFLPSGNGEFRFDTGALTGRLRAEGKGTGLASVVDTRSGTPVSHSPGLLGNMGLLSIYRVFSAGKRYGPGAYGWPSRAELHEDGSVTTIWPADADRPFTMRATYRWSAPSVVDFELTVQPNVDLPDFEAFLASYFSESFAEPRIYAGEGSFLAAGKADGEWQMFPRTSALSIIHDGRWKFEPNPVDWAIRPEMKLPLALRTDAKQSMMAVVMVPPGDCFAASTSHAGEPHFPLYFSLFGRTIRQGETARAHARIVIAAPADPASALRLYREWEARGWKK
jgi:hypothetical protein